MNADTVVTLALKALPQLFHGAAFQCEFEGALNEALHGTPFTPTAAPFGGRRVQ
jgi:hypothetical protein